MIDTIIAESAPGETRVALLAGERVVEVFHHRAGAESLVGDIHLGRITRVAPTLDAAFVDLGGGRVGFLNAAAGHCCEGEAVLVQVDRDPTATKGARLTARPTLRGPRLALTPGGRGAAVSRRIADDAERARLKALIESASAGRVIASERARGADADALAHELAGLRAIWARIEARRRDASAPALLHRDLGPLARTLRDVVGPGPRRVIANDARAAAEASRRLAELGLDLGERIEIAGPRATPFADLGVEAALAAAREPCLALPSGGRVTIEPGEALCAIDVDLGRGEGQSAAGAARRANLEAAEAIASSLRLRAIGGLMVIDFATMATRGDRRRVLAALAQALADDRAAVAPTGFTPLGLVEMTRRRDRPPLADVLCGPRRPGDGARRSLSAESVALAIARDLVRARPAALAVMAAPEVIAALTAEPLASALRAALGSDVTLRPDPARARESHDIVAA